MSAFVQKCDVLRACNVFLYGMYSSSTVVLLLSVYTGNYRIVFAVPVYYCSSKKVYSIVYILLQLHSKYNTILRLIDGTWYITEWNSESRYGKWYHFSNPCRTPLCYDDTIVICREEVVTVLGTTVSTHVYVQYVI